MAAAYSHQEKAKDWLEVWFDRFFFLFFSQILNVLFILKLLSWIWLCPTSVFLKLRMHFEFYILLIQDTCISLYRVKCPLRHQVCLLHIMNKVDLNGLCFQKILEISWVSGSSLSVCYSYLLSTELKSVSTACGFSFLFFHNLSNGLITN